jgi:hypothetical protein
MSCPQDQGVSGRIPAGDTHVISGESVAEVDIKDPVRVDERRFPDLVNSDRQTKPRQNAKAQDIGFP